MFLVPCVALRCVIRYLKPKSDSMDYMQLVYFEFNQEILIMPAISRVHKFQFLVFVIQKKVEVQQ
jgi:hypothetical protein